MDNHRKALAVMLGLPDSNVRVISRFLGSGFGGKLWPWPQSALAAVAAQHVRRPVKLVVTRNMMFANVGHRPDTHQRVRLAATTAGKLIALDHDYWNTTSVLDDYVENCGEATPYFYSTPNLRVRSAFKRRNIGTPTAMRGPRCSTRFVRNGIRLRRTGDCAECRSREAAARQRAGDG